jgi:probable F420-dependent oxidoreductase
VDVCAAADQFAGQLRRQQVEVGATAGHHRAFAGVIDEHCDRAGGVRLGLDEVGVDALGEHVLAGQLTEPVTTDLADERRRQTAPGGPHRDVGGAPAGREQHLAEGVAATQQFAVGADQDVPREVADHGEPGVHRRARYQRAPNCCQTVLVQPLRFGYQTRGGNVDEIRSQARDAEAAGFDVFHTSDHVSPGWTALMPLAAAAAVTQMIRLCPLVINNDFHHPVHLAREIADLDEISDGRMELGLGAGHSFTEYAAIGQPFDPPATRKARMIESMSVLHSLLRGDEVTVAGEHYRLDGVRTKAARQQSIPIMAAVNGTRWWAEAVAVADIVAPTMLGRTLADGQRHDVRWNAAHVDESMAFIAEQCRRVGRSVELNALVQMVEVTDDRRGWMEAFCAEVDGLSVDDALVCPFLCVGTHDEIADHVVECRRRWGFSYFSVRSIERFAPVIERLRSP